MATSDIEARVESMRQRLEEAQLDALVVSSAANRRWLTGFTGSAGTVMITRREAVLLVDFRYTEMAKMQAPVFQVTQVDEVNRELAAFFRRQNVRRAGFESIHVVHKTWQQLQRDVSDVEWVPVDSWVEEARGCKTEAELEAISAACAITDRAFSRILEHVRPGVTERQLAFELEFILRQEGAERLGFDSIVAAGPNGALPHAVPSDRAIERGDLVTLDFGAVWQGYHADMTRTVAVGTATPRQKELYALVLAAQEAGLAAVAPGKKGKEVDAVARQVIADAGYAGYFGHGLGHGVGLQIHEEYPRLSPRGEVVLKPGMVCSVEPGVYIPGWGGIRIEDLVVVTAQGCRVLSTSPKELLVL